MRVITLYLTETEEALLLQFIEQQGIKHPIANQHARLLSQMERTNRVYRERIQALHNKLKEVEREREEALQHLRTGA